MFTKYTKEEWEVITEKSRIARETNKLARLESMKTLKNDYLDMNYWKSLGTQYKVRFPYEGIPVSSKEIRKALRKCKVPIEKFNEHYTNCNYFVKNNPLWTAQAITGLILELKHEMMNQESKEITI